METPLIQFCDKGQDSAAMDQSQNRPSSPQAYHILGAGPSNVAFGGSGSDPAYIQDNDGFMSHTAFGTTRGGPTVMVTQPVVVEREGPPDTSCALVMSTLSAILCGFVCGAAGILLTWRAKLHVLNKQYEHARHSLRVAWLFFGMGCLFGACIWFAVGTVLHLVLSLISHH